MTNLEALEIADKALGFIQKARVAAQVRESHLNRAGATDPLTIGILKRAEDFEEWLNQEVRQAVKSHPAYPWFSRVKGIGDLNIGKVIAKVDISRAQTVSALWRYAGYAVFDGKAERREAGKKSHHNQDLKTMCWRLAKSLIRANGKYADLYRREKEKAAGRLDARGIKIVPAADLPKEKGKKIETEELLSLGHHDNMAMRKMIKIFLSHLWIVWRQAENLSVSKPYAQQIQGHDHYLDPWEFVEKGK
jgi:hypothetical protein